MKLYVVSIGPGGAEFMTPRALDAIAESDVVAGYGVYLELIAPLTAGKELISSQMTLERERCVAARDRALGGETVAIVSSGDAGVYGMAGLVFEVCRDYPELEIEIIPGVTAATSAAAVLGAPLMHDFAVISLSDLLTPWETIERRVELASQADFVICLYNPGSHTREAHLRRACDIMLARKSPDTPCGVVRNIGRDGQASRVLTLAELRETAVDMFTTVIIGNSHTRVINGKLVTPRGYEARSGAGANP
jgi:precorrin-3B C17-methyltransferase